MYLYPFLYFFSFIYPHNLSLTFLYTQSVLFLLIHPPSYCVEDDVEVIRLHICHYNKWMTILFVLKHA